MTVNPDERAQRASTLLKEIVADSAFRREMAGAARMAGRAISAVWARHNGNEVSVAIVLNAWQGWR